MEKQIHREHRTLSYRIAGSGPAVMLVHGFGEDGRVWELQMNSLQQDYTVIVPDLPGSGDSELLEHTSMESLADILNMILEQEAIEKLVMIGHSMGGYVSLAFAEKYPQKLKGLGLFHSMAFADSEEKKDARRKSIGFIRQHGAVKFLEQSIPNLFSPAFKANHPDIYARFVEDNTNFSEDALVSYYEAMINRPDRTAVLEKLAVPALFIIGLHDKAIPQDQSLRQTHIPSLSYVLILQDSGHQGMLEEPEKSTTFLKKFLLEIEIVTPGGTL